VSRRCHSEKRGECNASGAVDRRIEREVAERPEVSAIVVNQSGNGAMIHAMNVTDAIAQRRSIKKFEHRPVTRDEIEFLLDTAVLAPNHHLTQPWRFYVLGPDARRAYGLALGDRKARKVPDADTANAVRQKTATEYHDLPGLIAVAMVVHENAETREEDYAAVMQAVANITLAAVERGLGTHIRTGAVMDDPAARAAIGARDGERIVAMLSVGVPAEVPTPRPRQAATSVTTWMP
jgi:nitroreductase